MTRLSGPSPGTLSATSSCQGPTILQGDVIIYNVDIQVCTVI